MSSILDVAAEYSQDIDIVNSFCTNIYDTQFSTNFSEIHELYNRMKSKVRPITDKELEYVLTMFPLELFTVAEKLNALRLNYEVVRLKNKETLEKLRRSSAEEAESLGMNKTQTAEYVSHKIAEKMIEYEVLASAYSSVITRVENEQSFAKELIMGCKKVWDSRRSAESSNPVSCVSAELPDYEAKPKK